MAKQPKVIEGPEVDRKLKMLIYGKPGVGKTRFACSGAGKEGIGKVYVISAEEGSSSAAHFGISRSPLIHSTSDANRILRGLMTGRDEFEGIGTVVLDTVTELQEMALNEIAAGEDGMPTLEQYSQRDYLRVKRFIGCYVRQLLQLPYNVILTAQEGIDYEELPDKDGKRVIQGIGPKLSAAISRMVQTFTEFTWYMTRKGPDDYRCRYGPKRMHAIKTRIENAPKWLGGRDGEMLIKDMNLAEIREQIIKARTETAKEISDVK